jgi:hypothetical protein
MVDIDIMLNLDQFLTLPEIRLSTKKVEAAHYRALRQGSALKQAAKQVGPASENCHSWKCLPAGGEARVLSRDRRIASGICLPLRVINPPEDRRNVRLILSESRQLFSAGGCHYGCLQCGKYKFAGINLGWMRAKR